MSRSWRLVRQHPQLASGGLLLSLLLGAALLAPLIYPVDPFRMVGRPLLPPLSPGFPLGTDMLGRDAAAALLHGARVSFLVAAASTLGGAVLGIALGCMAGYFGGWVDGVLRGVMSFFQVMPGFLFCLVLLVILVPSLESMILAITLVSWPPIAQLVRAEVLSLRRRDFVSAAIVGGHSTPRILLVQILPNALSPVLAALSLAAGSAILTESGLSFLGLGDRNHMSWGFMIGAARTMVRHAWWTGVFPGVAIVMAVLAFNLLADGAQAALQPRRLRERA